MKNNYTKFNKNDMKDKNILYICLLHYQC